MRSITVLSSRGLAALVITGALVCIAPRTAHAQKGFADLHNHPASHLVFGHKDKSEGGDACNESEGIFHGSPGTFLDLSNPDATIADDLRACNPETHAYCDNTSVVQKRQRTAILNRLETHYGTHLATGASSFEGWPNASSRTHQQMHLKWLKRAFDGGLRLMIASVTDSELLSKWYHDDHNCDGGPTPTAGANFDSSVKQIKFIEQLAVDNASWMGIAKTAAEARDLLDTNRLVLILGVEHDSLTRDETLTLIRDYGVRSVIPVHLTDNDIGGTAVYSDLFNHNNYWLRNEFYKIEPAPNLSFRLGRPSFLGDKLEFPVGCSWGPKPEPLGDGDYGPMNYECGPGSDPFLCAPPPIGHQNSKGILDPQALRAFMHEGVLLDIAHMGFRSVEDTLSLAESFDYPLIDSHTGLRDSAVVGKDERAITLAQARRIARGGGVIGLGTEGTPPEQPLVAVAGAPATRLTGNVKEFRSYYLSDDEMPPNDVADRFVVRVATGDDDLRGSDGIACSASRARLAMTTTAGTFNLDVDLARGAGLGKDTVHEATIDLTTLPASARTLGNIRSFALTLLQGGGCISQDNWNVDGLTIEYVGRTVIGTPTGGLLLERTGAPYRRLTGSMPTFSTSLRRAMVRRESNRADFVRTLDFRFRTGGDDLHSGTGCNLTLAVALRDGRTLKRNVCDLTGFSGGFHAAETATGTWDIATQAGTPIRYGDIVSVYFSEHSSSVYVDWDNWDVASYRVLWSGCRDSACTLPTGGTLADRASTSELSGDQAYRMNFDRRALVAWNGLRGPLPLSHPISTLRASINTGIDDLRSGSNAWLVLRLASGPERVLPLNHGSLYDSPSTHQVFPINIDPPIVPSDIVSIGVRTDFGGGLSGDNWNIDGLVIDVLGDPAREWVEGLNRAFDAMFEKGEPVPGIALGTDLNGLQPQMAYAWPNKAGKDPDLTSLPVGFQIPRGDVTAGRAYSFELHGLAHIGLLPDFVNTMQGFDDTRPAVLLDSAEATIRTWEKAELRAPTVTP